MAKENQAIKGISIHLFRLPSNGKTNFDPADDDLFVWGEFDWARFSFNIDNLRDLYDDKILQNYNSEKNNPPEEQIIRGYYKNNDIEKGYFSSLDENPCLVISEIKTARLNKKALHLVQGYDEVKRILESKKYAEINEFYLCYSLGYSDLLLITTSSSYSKILSCLDELKTKDFIFSIRSIPCIYPKHITNWEVAENERLSILGSLRQEIAPSHYINNSPDTDRSFQNTKYSVNSLFGLYDLEINLDQGGASMKDIGKGIVNHIYPKNGNTEKLPPFLRIKDFHRSLTNIKITYSNDNVHFINQTSRQRNDSKNNKDGNPHLKRLKKLISGTETPSRQSQNQIIRDIIRITNIYWQSKQNRRTDSYIESILEELFDNLITELKNNNRKDLSDEDSYLFHKRFSTIVSSISDVVQNLTPSSDVSLNSPDYSSTFLSSSLKIYITYFQIIKLVCSSIDKLLNINKDEKKFLFYPVINNSALINSELFFPATNQPNNGIIICNPSKAKKIVVIQCNLEDFISLKTSIPLFLHEIGHYYELIPPKTRNELFMKEYLYMVSYETVATLLAQDVEETTPILGDNDVLKNLIFDISNEISDLLYNHFSKPKIFSSLKDESVLDIFAKKLCKMVQTTFVFNFDIYLAEARETKKYASGCKTAILKDDNVQTLPGIYRFWMQSRIDSNESFEDIAKMCKLPVSEELVMVSIEYDVFRTERLKLIEDIVEIFYKHLFENSESFFFRSAFTQGLKNNVKDDEVYVNYISFLSSRGLLENNAYSKKHIKRVASDVLSKIKYSVKLKLLQTLFEEVAADTFMIGMLKLGFPDYQKLIAKSAESAKLYYESNDARLQRSLFKKREEIIRKLLSSEIEEKSVITEASSSRVYSFTTVRDETLLEYSKNIYTKLKNVPDRPSSVINKHDLEKGTKILDIQDLRNAYQNLTKLKADVFDGGDDSETPYSDLKFISEFTLQREMEM